MVDLRSSTLAAFLGIAIGVLGMVHGLKPVHAERAAPIVVSAPASHGTALGTATHVVVARAR